MAVIPVYGIDTALFVPSETPRAQLRGRLGLPLECSLVFFSSRVAPEKDPDTLIEAVGALRRQGRDVRILHLSGGYEEFLARAAAAGLAEAVIARDAVAPFDGLAAYYQASDVCVQASRDEGLGFSVLEALACEVPVVATAVGGLRETIRDGDTGWTYPAGDAARLADALVTVLDGAEHAAAAARRGRTLVRQSFERRVVFDELVTFLQGWPARRSWQRHDAGHTRGPSRFRRLARVVARSPGVRWWRRGGPTRGDGSCRRPRSKRCWHARPPTGPLRQSR